MKNLLTKPICISKYIFVTGGVISSVGKGITTSYIGALLKSHGYNVTAIKIDPYINIDAGTFSPYEHGEVFVLDDGGEVDLDLGNYERMLDCSLSRENNITTGKIYDLLIKKERSGDYLGQTVQIIPHLTDLVQDWLVKVADNEQFSNISNICLVEVGGVLGDCESSPFLEAIRQFQTRVTRQNYCHIHVSLLPHTVDGEQKTKPTQMSIRLMRSLGLLPDFIFCRSTKESNLQVKQKISLYCDTPVSNIIVFPNYNNMNQIYIKLMEENFISLLNNRLGLTQPQKTDLVDKWIQYCHRSFQCNNEVRVCVVGKYCSHPDAYYSIKTALTHACISRNKKLILHWIDSDKLYNSSQTNLNEEFNTSWDLIKKAQAIVIPGGFDKRGIEGIISAINYARINKIPILGICLGLQLMAVEFARSELGLTNANSSEVEPDTPNPIIIQMPEFNPEIKGATMRLGLRETVFTDTNCHSYKLYGNKISIYERHRHRYEFNTYYKNQFQQFQFRFVAQDTSGTRMEIIELPITKHPFFVGVQFHPEFLSRPLSPSPLFIGLIDSINNT